MNERPPCFRPLSEHHHTVATDITCAINCPCGSCCPADCECQKCSLLWLCNKECLCGQHCIFQCDCGYCCQVDCRCNRCVLIQCHENCHCAHVRHCRKACRVRGCNCREMQGMCRCDGCKATKTLKLAKAGARSASGRQFQKYEGRARHNATTITTKEEIPVNGWLSCALKRGGCLVTCGCGECCPVGCRCKKCMTNMGVCRGQCNCGKHCMEKCKCGSCCVLNCRCHTCKSLVSCHMRCNCGIHCISDCLCGRCCVRKCRCDTCKQSLACRRICNCGDCCGVDCYCKKCGNKPIPKYAHNEQKRLSKSKKVR